VVFPGGPHHNVAHIDCIRASLLQNHLPFTTLLTYRPPPGDITLHYLPLRVPSHNSVSFLPLVTRHKPPHICLHPNQRIPRHPFTPFIHPSPAISHFKRPVGHLLQATYLLAYGPVTHAQRIPVHSKPSLFPPFAHYSLSPHTRQSFSTFVDPVIDLTIAITR
jgi:hypothetical protein